MTAIQEELQSLLATCRMLMRSILTVSRDDDDPRAWPIRIRAAKGHVNKAVITLNLDPSAANDTPETLGRIASSLTSRLVQDLMAEVDRGRPADLKERNCIVHDRDGFHGYNWAIPLPDLMSFLQVQQKSGILRVNIGSEVVSLIFDDGDLIHASSDNSPPGSRLGEILVEQGAIDLDSLGRFLVRYAASPGLLGKTLEAEGMITKESLRSALDRQVEHIFRRMFTSEDAYYSFREGHSEENIDVRRNVFQLLLETCRVQDEAQQDDERAEDDSAA